MAISEEKARIMITPKKVTEYLLASGFAPNLKGFSYIRDAIMAIQNIPLGMRQIYKGVYALVAQRNVSTQPRVERAIRHAIQVACETPKFNDKFNKYLGNMKPKNGEFLMLLYEILKMEAS